MDSGGAAPLSGEQRAFFEHATAKRANALAIGPAGTGKSYVVSLIDERFEAQGVTLVKLAHQGIAAVNIDGVTICRFMRAGFRDEQPEDMLRAWCKLAAQAPSMRNAHVHSAACVDAVFVDEISQVSPRLFALLEAFLRAAKGARDPRTKRWEPSELPWGGVQVLGAGDMLQTLPVEESEVRCA